MDRRTDETRHHKFQAVTILKVAGTFAQGRFAPSYAQRKGKKREAFHYHRGCPVRADLIDAVAPLHFGVGGYCEWSHCSDLGKRYRVCDRGGAVGDALA